MTPGKFLQRILKVSPTGDMPKTMCRFLALLLTKYCHKLSLEGSAPFCRASSRTWLRTDSFSSSGNSAGTMPTKGTRLENYHVVWDSMGFGENKPEVSMLLMSSKNPSSATCASVKRNTVFLFSMPSFKYSAFKSSRKLDSLYPLLSVISNTYKNNHSTQGKRKCSEFKLQSLNHWPMSVYTIW